MLPTSLCRKWVPPCMPALDPSRNSDKSPWLLCNNRCRCQSPVAASIRAFCSTRGLSSAGAEIVGYMSVGLGRLCLHIATTTVIHTLSLSASRQQSHMATDKHNGYLSPQTWASWAWATPLPDPLMKVMGTTMAVWETPSVSYRRKASTWERVRKR